MFIIKSAGRLLSGLLLFVTISAARADLYLPDGHAWEKATERERVAYILGLSNTLTIGYVSDEKRLPGNEQTFTHRAVKGLSGTSVQQAVAVIDAWYKANPEQLNIPVLKVLWDQIGKPRLAESE